MSESLSSGFFRIPYPGQRWVDLEYLGTPGFLASSNATIYTAPATVNAQNGTVTSRVILVDLWITNTDTVARTIRLHIVVSGGTATAANALFYDTELKASESIHYSEMRTLVPAGGTIEGMASSASKVNFRFTGEVVR